MWIEGHPNDELRASWKYYLDETEQQHEIQVQDIEICKEFRKLKPEDIRCIDPCCGSGHILAYMFDVLIQIYEFYGYTAREATTSILLNNIYGVDVDERAGQLSYFVVMMKARKYDRYFFRRGIQPHVFSVIESNNIDQSLVKYFANDDDDLKKAIQCIIDEMHDAKEYGSLLNISSQNWEAIDERISIIQKDTNFYRDPTLYYLKPIIEVAHIISGKYDVVVTNPPYLSAGDTSPKCLNYIKKHYITGRTDLFAVFMMKCCSMTKNNRYFAMITMQAWMFQSSFKQLREQLLNLQLSSLIHLGSHAFEDIGGEIVQTTSYVFLNRIQTNYAALYIDESNIDNAIEKENAFLTKDYKLYICTNNKIKKIPGCKYSYWISTAALKAFDKSIPLKDVGVARRGLQTGNASRFIRFWYEIDFTQLALPNQDIEIKQINWVLENNGGPVRRWYNSIINAVLWKDNGKAIKNCSSSIVPSENLYFRRCLTWNKLTTKGIALKLQEPGIIPGDLSPFFIPKSDDEFCYYFGLLNSNVADYMMHVLNPTITTPTGDVSAFPVIVDLANLERINLFVKECVEISKKDACQSEDSWEFSVHPLTYQNVIQDAVEKWNYARLQRKYKLVEVEKELNQLFIEIYGLENELDPIVNINSVTLQQPNLREDIVSYISYAVGCIFGRYSSDHEGLIYAGGNWDPSKYQTFQADEDNIIPICDDEYFEDDLSGLFVRFIQITNGEDTLERNLQFIAEALGGNGTSREIIRRYFTNDFFKDHCKIYRKRPIYWLFDSGKKNGFKALIYMHRYQPDTIARMRTDYVHEQQSRYRTAITELEQQIERVTTSERVKLKKQLTRIQAQAKEIREYEEKIHHLADQYISINLDDGVKQNYAIFQDVLAQIQ